MCGGMGYSCPPQDINTACNFGMMHQYNNDARVSAGHQLIRQYKNQPLDEYLKQDNNRDDFLFLMNMFENVAIGVDHKIYDEKMIKGYFSERELKTVYQESKKFIDHIREREEDPKAFTEFERMVADEKITNSRTGKS